MAKGGADAAIVRFWWAVEMFSPPKIEDEPSWDNKVFRLSPDEVPPWHPAHPLARVRLERDKVWQHTVFGGIFGLEQLRDVVVAAFGNDAKYRDARLDGSTAVFSLTLTQSGRLVEDSQVLSACAWATGRVLARRPWRGNWLDKTAWATARVEFEELTRHLGEPPVPTMPGGSGAGGGDAGGLGGRVRSAAADAAEAGVTAAVAPLATSVAGPLLGGAVGKAAGTFAKKMVEPEVANGGGDGGGRESRFPGGSSDGRRPVDPRELFALLEEQVSQAGIGRALEPTEIWVASKQVHVRSADTADSDFLNSFLFDDLERVQDALLSNDGSKVLGEFLRPTTHIDVRSRVDVRTNSGQVLAEVAPKHTPVGRWVGGADRPLALSQQFAVNQILSATRAGTIPVYAVNGPPGTGKTTMLRDVIAALVVERAIRLSKLKRPADAFGGSVGSWSTEVGTRKVRPLIPELTGFEMVVACASNGAAKNITHEFPGPDGIDASWLEAAREVDYFADAASIALEIEDAEPGRRAWAAVAGALGKMELRRNFSERLWWGVTAKEEAAAKRDTVDGRKRRPDRSGAGLADLLTEQTRNGTPIDWPAAVNRFVNALVKVEELEAGRQAAADAAEIISKSAAQTAALEQTLAEADKAVALATEKADIAAATLRRGQEIVAQGQATRAEHAGRQPNLWTSLSTRGRAGREWYEKDRQLAALQDQVSALYEQTRQEALATSERLDTARRRRTEIADQLATVESRAHEAKRIWRQALADWKDRVPLSAVFADDALREKSAPWNDQDIADARTRLFLEALLLHKQFLLATSETTRRNLQAAFDIISGSAPPDVKGETAKAAWQALFLAVPVVSTTFASMGRLFSHLGCEDLGWLFIDEAGQATPAGAVGAMWRAEHAVIVGDPRQLEPVITVPHSLQQALREHFGVGEEWLPGRVSVQTLADRLAPYGTYLDVDDQDGQGDRVWVGAPLRVHRRCDAPMFDISNDIAYGGTLMVNGKKPIEPDEDPYLDLRASSWVHVAGQSNGDSPWIPAEGHAVRALIAELRQNGVRRDRIRVISPFRKVVRGVSELSLGLPREAVGTIHTMQGKEADIVILVLGSSNGGQRVWAAEKPNLLNVAVSRAKRRLYVVGNRDLWKRQQYFNQLAARLPVVAARPTSEGADR